MLNFLKKFSLAPQGIRYKLLISFVLMSLIPILLCGYLITNYITIDQYDTLLVITIILLLTVIIAWLGLALAKNIIEPIIDMSIDAKNIASGKFDKTIKISADDEVGVIGNSINVMMCHLRENMKILKDYGEKTKEINFEIQKKMISITDFLEINDLLASRADLSQLIDVILSKISSSYSDAYAIVYLPKDRPDEYVMANYTNIHDSELLRAKIKIGNDFLGSIMKKGKPIVLDKSLGKGTKETAFLEKHKLPNAMVVPIFTAKEIMGLLIVGNFDKNFSATNDDMDMIKIFAKQISIALENQLLLKNAEYLALKDDLTGLYNKSYILSRLGEEIERAVIYQRPCSFIVMDIDDFKKYVSEQGLIAVEAALKKIAEAIRKYMVEPIDKAGRIGDDSFGVILPEKNKRNALAIAEALRNTIQTIIPVPDKKAHITVSIGVSENPLDGASANELVDKAMHNLKKAKDSGKNRVEG